MDDPPDDVAVGGGSGAIRIPGRGVAAASRPRGSRGRRGRGRDHPASRGGRFDMPGGLMTMPPPRQPPTTTTPSAPPTTTPSAPPTTTQPGAVLDPRRSKKRHDPLLI